MNRVEIVRKLIDERFSGNQSAFARAIGKTPTHIYQWLNGIRNIGDGTARQIELALNLPEKYMWGECADIEKIDIKKQEETKFVGVPPQSHIMSDDNFDHSHTHLSIPRYEVKLSAGNGTAQWVELTDKEPLIFRASWFFERHLSPEHLRAMTVKGDSMTPVLENGDTVIIDIEDTEIIDGEIYAILYKEKLYIKELRHTENGVLMISKNTDYNAIAVTQHDENRFFVLGRKVWRGG